MVEKKAKAATALKEGEEKVKVYLRLRPMDKLETSKRSKDCIELHENPKLITVDSPLLGTFDFTFDQVSSKNESALDTSGDVRGMTSVVCAALLKIVFLNSSV